jgi:hypothetical protein
VSLPWQGNERRWRKWWFFALLPLALIVSSIWYVRRPHPDEKLLHGSWLTATPDGSRTLWIANDNHRWTAWDVDHSGRKSYQKTSGRWSFDGKVIVLREQLPGRSPLDVLFGHKTYDSIHLNVVSLQPDVLVTRYQSNGDRLEWTRQAEDVSP